MRLANEEIEAMLERVLLRRDAGRCPQAAVLALYVCGDATREEALEFERHLLGCAECRADLHGFHAAAAPWKSVGQRSLAWRLRARLRQPVLFVAAGAAAAVAIVLAVSPRVLESHLVQKGAPQFHVAVERDGHVFRANEGVALRSGDRLGFFYTAGSPAFLAIVYVDESQEVVRLHPTDDAFSAPVSPGNGVRLPNGAVINDGRGCEWVVALFSHERLDERGVVSAVKRMVATRSGCELGRSGLTGVTVQSLGVRR